MPNFSERYPKVTRCDECGDLIPCLKHPGAATFEYPECPPVEISRAAAALGKLGGKAGKGAAKVRGDSAYYAALAAKRKPKH